MRPITILVEGVGNSPIAPMNTYACPFNVGFGVAVTGTINYTIQHTFDDLDSGPPTNWFNHPTIASQSANADGNYAFPVTGIRIVGNSGNGTAVLHLVQSGGMNR